MKNNWQRFEPGMPVAEMTFFVGNQMHVNINTRKPWWIITLTAALDPMILVVIGELQPHLVSQIHTEVMIQNNMIPIENELGFLEVPGTIDLSLEVRILEAVCMILVHATTNSLVYSLQVLQY